MNIFLFAIHFSVLALGAVSAFIIDLFFVTSAKTRILSTRDVKMIYRLNFSALVSVVIALVTDVSIISFQVMDATNSGFSYWLLKLLLLSIVFLAALSLRKIHLPTLLRHQKHNAHLSDSFIRHSDALINTVVVSTITWISAIMATTYEYVANIGRVPSVLSFLILYCIALFLSIKLFSYLKEKITRIHSKK